MAVRYRALLIQSPSLLPALGTPDDVRNGDKQRLTRGSTDASRHFIAFALTSTTT